ncbi:hypothetical protein BPAE_0034g00390 [Botrytis paeoniae]|uniref:Uncharacterized protein n=1 Tax=Botrytis paeoniae TaxID=278948 RepID=A0A4Z1FYK1_9HELO|nr:hypothetical protein BPAE_0034g00390 [Botrytis paeoniae]
MCCCFGSRGEHVEPVKKIPQDQVDEKKKLYESNSHRAPVPASLDHYRNRSRSSSNSGRNGYPNRSSQIGHSNSGYGSNSSRDSRDYYDRDTTHGYSQGGYSQGGYSQGGYSQGGYSQGGRSTTLGNRALASGLDTSRYTSGGRR